MKNLVLKDTSTLKEAVYKLDTNGNGFLAIVDKNNKLIGILTDGDIKRLVHKFDDIKRLQVKDIIKKGPISVEKEQLAVRALKIMNDKKITSLCVHSKSKKNKTIGLIHIHNILDANIQ